MAQGKMLKRGFVLNVLLKFKLLTFLKTLQNLALYIDGDDNDTTFVVHIVVALL